MRSILIKVYVILLLLSVTFLTKSCLINQQEKQKNFEVFLQLKREVNKQEQAVLEYDKKGTDSIMWLNYYNRLYKGAIDSAIQYCQNNFNINEKPYNRELSLLYVYRDRADAYANWVAYNTTIISIKKNDTISHQKKYNEYSEILRVLNELYRTNTHIP